MIFGRLAIDATSPLAIGICIGLYLYWMFVGYALHCALGHRVASRANLLRSALLAPVSGFAVTLFGVFWLNRCGLPIKSFGAAWGAALLIGAGVVYLRMRPPVPLKETRKYAWLLALALALTAWPMAEFGIWWLSYCNDDMANYCLAAQRHYEHGFFDMPDLKRMASGAESSLFYWFMHVPAEMRPGSEIHLSWAMSVTGLMPHQIFMPLSVALQLALISAVCGLVVEARGARRAGLWVGFGLACSALVTLGTIYQLIAQVGGLALLTACLAVCSQWCAARNHLDGSFKGQVGGYALASLLVSVLLFTYSEVLPFLVLSLGLFTLLQARNPLQRARRLVIPAAIVAIGVLGLLNISLFNTLDSLYTQATSGLSGLKDVTIAIFPFYLIPSGFGNLWGLIPIGHTTTPIGTTIPILAGMALTLLLTWACLAQKRERISLVASFCLVCLTLGAKLFIGVSDFGLFKLSMYATPFFIAMMVVFLLNQRWSGARLLLAGILLSPLYVQFMYVYWSQGDTGTLAEIRGASRAKINQQFERAIAPVSGASIVDTENIVLAKFTAAHNQGKPLIFPTQFYFNSIVNGTGYSPLLGSYRTRSRELVRDYLAMSQNDEYFVFHHPDGRVTTNGFAQIHLDNNDSHGDLSLITSHGLSFYNSFHKAAALAPGMFMAERLSDVRNHLMFISSQLGQPYYTNLRKTVSFYQFEPDVEFPGKLMSGLGRHHLFEVVNPTPRPRFVISLTATLKADGMNQLPPCEIAGATGILAGLVGRGSARVLPEAPTPQVIGGRDYYGLDTGMDGVMFPMNKRRIMSWYGNDVPLDNRRLVAFVRDISLISAEEYAQMAPPRSLSNFPQDLIPDQVEYSGIYEDGWIAEECFVVLKQSSGADAQLRISGFVPQITGRTWPKDLEMRVLLDGRDIGGQTLGTGDFLFACALPATDERRRIGIRMSSSLPLPAPDNRPVSAKLRFIGFTSEADAASGATQQDIVDSQQLTLGKEWFPLEIAEGEASRWLGSEAAITLARAPSGTGLLKVSLEVGSGAAGRPLSVAIIAEDGSVLGTREATARHDFTFPLHFADHDRPHVLRIRLAGATGQPTANDARKLSVRVFSITWLARP